MNERPPGWISWPWILDDVDHTVPTRVTCDVASLFSVGITTTLNAGFPLAVGCSVLVLTVLHLRARKWWSGLATLLAGCGIVYFGYTRLVDVWTGFVAFDATADFIELDYLWPSADHRLEHHEVSSVVFRADTQNDTPDLPGGSDFYFVGVRRTNGSVVYSYGSTAQGIPRTCAVRLAELQEVPLETIDVRTNPREPLTK